MSIREAYASYLQRDGHIRDPAQDEVVAVLDELQQRLLTGAGRHNGIFGVLRRAIGDADAVAGVYLWGGVGRGKTFLMDLFFETLATPGKHRIHFHRMMREVHTRLKALASIEDPLDRVAADIAAETRVLCFDEFFVSDIGDAMILGRLLDGLFERGVTLVATSNAHPDDLYRDGLQRQRFLPAIESLKTNTRVIEIGGGVDHRLRLLQQAGTYLSPDDDDARHKLRHFFDDSASSQVSIDHILDINGREVPARMCAKGIAWFDFEALCAGPRSQNDYIEIARWYPSVILSGVPQLHAELDDQARRFIALVDEFYDRRVKLIVAADVGLDSLYTGQRLAFEFERTASRLAEMQSTDYLAAPHLA